jgi:ribosome biogenesis ATPase
VPIVVIGATNQVDSLDIGLRRAGRFDQEIAIGIPDDKQRKRILDILCRKIRKHSDIDMERIVLNTPGYVGADLNALIDEALISALDRRLCQQIGDESSETAEEKQISISRKSKEAKKLFFFLVCDFSQ